MQLTAARFFFAIPSGTGQTVTYCKGARGRVGSSKLVTDGSRVLVVCDTMTLVTTASEAFSNVFSVVHSPMHYTTGER